MKASLHNLARNALLATVLAATLAAPAAWADNASDAPLNEGVWRNSKDTVHVELKPCGAEVCGYVVWANEDVQRAARRAGTKQILGLQLLRDFARTAAGKVYHGKVFAPDLNATFSGTAERVDAHTLKARGCLLAGVFCKSQVWTRIDTPSPG